MQSSDGEPAPTRFCPTLSGYPHVGSWWCAFLNWSYGRSDGIILRHEDMTALHTVGNANFPTMMEFAKNFRSQFEKHGIPIWKEVWQSEVKEECELINQSVFGGVLSWDITNWRSRIRYWGIPYPNFAGESPLMAQLTRVYSDRRDGVRYVIRGLELAAEKEAYWVLWHLAFPDTKPEERPFLWFIPEVAQPEGFKISKSNTASVNYALRDIEVDTVKMAAGLVRNQMVETSTSGAIKDYIAGNRDECLMGLRQFVRLALFNPTPQPIGVDKILEWRP